METRMDYEGRIYKLVCDDGYFYIGSTKTELKKRLYNHKKTSEKQTERKVYKHINSIGWDKVKIVLIEEYLCSTKEELVKREYEHIQKHKEDKHCLNICGTFNKDGYFKQYYELNKDVIKQKTKQYRDNHLDKIKLLKQQWYENNKQLIKEKNKRQELKSKTHIYSSKDGDNKTPLEGQPPRQIPLQNDD